ncbi:hypothetical protein [Synechococcus sp. Tobar12-5m-g]|uniref:hypothetical protein n=1 Tax=Synechococcus sp. Tobar12-5m-g TaxID=2823742 RepID=UPI0020CE4238|nr:hypothetical protein [Synechococcus sp. Tobar12-5m-g]
MNIGELADAGDLILALRGGRPGILVDAIEIEICGGCGQGAQKPKGNRRQQQLLERFHWILTPIEGASIGKLGEVYPIELALTTAKRRSGVFWDTPFWVPKAIGATVNRSA